MKNFLYLFVVFLFLALQVRGLQLQSTSAIAQCDMAGEKIAHRLYGKVSNNYESFIDTVAEKMYNKFEQHLDNPAIGTKMMVLLQNDAELLNHALKRPDNLALIQTLFFKKLKEKFMNSKFGQTLMKWGKKIKDKLKDLYKKHGHKLKLLFKLLLKSFVLPLAVKFARKHLPQWKSYLLKLTQGMKEKTRVVVQRVIMKIFEKFTVKIEKLAAKYKIDAKSEDAAAKKIMAAEKDVKNIEKQEADAQKEQAKVEKAEKKAAASA